MATPTIQSGQVKTGPGIIYYKLGLSVMPTIPAPTASKITYTWATDTWIQVGATEEGLTYSESVDTSAITVAESLYPIRTVTTGKSGSVAFTMNHLSDLNWKLAMNGGTIVSSGTGVTKINTYVPPLVGSEVRVALGFQSLEDDEMIIWPQCFNVGSVEVARAGFDTKAGLPCEFAVELPDPAVLTTPYKRWVTGALAQGV